MSVHPENGNYRVKWRDESGRQRSKTFKRKGDAEHYDAEITRAKALGPHIMRELTRGTETLDDFIQGPWRLHAASLAPKTKAKYRWVLENHMGDLGSEPLVTLDVARLSAHQAWLLKKGLNHNTVREVLRMIGAILTIAAEHSRIPANPMRSLRRVAAQDTGPIATFSPAETEALIQRATDIDRAILVLGGHLGLRPYELRRVPWERLRGAKLALAKADVKPGTQPRVIDVPAASLTALKEWRLQAGRPDDSKPIVGLTSRNMNEWNKRLRRLAGRDDITAYTLRHSHASALHYASFTIPKAAERMGHTPLVHWRHYAHVLDALDGQRYPDLDALIAAARNPERSEKFRQSSAADPQTP